MKRYIIITILALVLVGFVLPVLAATELPPGAPITLDNVNTTIEGVAGWIIKISIFVMVISIVAAGLKIITAGANPTKYKEGLGWLKSAIIGSAVILASGVIINTIASVVSRNFFN
ncbi:hypothetical protein KW791_01295 [Candidatus Parcubacteria bacterium]|nr:hypothetical protein [Candidatus Parcubacteria bacterium]